MFSPSWLYDILSVGKVQNSLFAREDDSFSPRKKNQEKASPFKIFLYLCPIKYMTNNASSTSNAMRRIIILLLSVLFVTAQTAAQNTSQQEPQTLAHAQKLDSLAQNLSRQERYHDAIELKRKALDLRRQLAGESDSAYICGLIFLGKYYYRDKQPEEAARVVKEGAALYAKYLHDDNDRYAFFLDNLSLYLGTCEKYAEAETYSRKALDVYEKLGKRDYDLALILMHVAENSSYNGHQAEAVRYEIRGLNVIKDVRGEHSDEYIGELPYLAKYYEAAGDKANAERVTNHVKKLQEEKDKGYADIPDPIELKSAQSCREHNDDALKCCRYYITHKLSAAEASKAGEYIIHWTIASDEFSVIVGSDLAKIAGTRSGMPYFVAFSAITGIYCIENSLKQLDEDHYVSAIDVLLQYYEPNRELTGPVDILEKYLKLAQEKKLESYLRKEFQKDQKAWLGEN